LQDKRGSVFLAVIDQLGRTEIGCNQQQLGVVKVDDFWGLPPDFFHNLAPQLYTLITSVDADLGQADYTDAVDDSIRPICLGDQRDVMASLYQRFALSMKDANIESGMD
jgi:hypothetical protein